MRENLPPRRPEAFHYADVSSMLTALDADYDPSQADAMVDDTEVVLD